MKLLFLRGQIDERTQKVNRLSESDDVWTHLAAAISDNTKILYAGGSRKVNYTDGINEEWIDNFKHWNTSYVPDVIFARGGFSYYEHVVRRFPSAISVYYGAGTRTFPSHKYYDIILVDDATDVEKGRNKGFNTYLWNKPAAPCFKPTQCQKVFDVCYVANGQQAKIKRIRWVYETIPPDISMLHLGYFTNYKVPENVMRVRAERSNMANMYSQCKVGIVPYTSYDSAPRALSEMIACGVAPIIVRDGVRANSQGPMIVASKEDFWDIVRVNLKTWHLRKIDNIPTVESEAARIRGLIENCMLLRKV